MDKDVHFDKGLYILDTHNDNSVFFLSTNEIGDQIYKSYNHQINITQLDSQKCLPYGTMVITSEIPFEYQNILPLCDVQVYNVSVQSIIEKLNLIPYNSQYHHLNLFINCEINELKQIYLLTCCVVPNKQQ